MKHIIITFIFFISLFTNISKATENIFLNDAEVQDRKLSVDNAEDRKIINEQINKILDKINDINKQIDSIRFKAAKEAGLDVSMDFIEKMRPYHYFYLEKEKNAEKIIEDMTDKEVEKLTDKKRDLEDEIDKLFVNNKMIELEKECDNKKSRRNDIEIETAKKAYPKLTEKSLKKIETYASLPSNERFNNKNKISLTKKEQAYYDLRYHYSYNRIKQDGIYYEEYKNLSDRISKIHDEIKSEREKAKISFAANNYDDTGKMPQYISSCDAYKVLHESKRYNDSKPSFSLFFDFGDNDKFVLKNDKLYKISNDKEELLMDKNIKLDISTDTFYSAIFDKEKQNIYIYMDIIAEPVEKNDYLITIDLKNKNVYSFYDDLPFFSSFYLYNNQIFATGRKFNGDEVLTYIIKDGKAEPVDDNNDIKFTYGEDQNFYMIKSMNLNDKDVVFLHILSRDKTKKPNPVKLLDSKTNKVYLLKCGYMYESYHWAKSYFNAVGKCSECDAPFGAFGLEYEAFIYTPREETKIYSGCGGNTEEPPISIEEFCKDIDEY